MSLWVALALPQLALEAVWSPAMQRLLPATLAVHEHEHIVQCSKAAQQQGVQPGMRVAAAQAMCPQLVVATREREAEAALQEQLAMAMQPFTPQLAMPEPDIVVLEVSGSLRLFRGIVALCHRIHQAMKGVPVTVVRGVAPTLRGAMILARVWALSASTRQRSEGSVPRPRVLRLSHLQQRLEVLPWRVLPEAQPHADWLVSLGCRTLGDLNRLPRSGLRQRTHASLLQALDQAWGREVHSVVWWQPPQSFRQGFEPLEALEHLHQLQEGAEHLLRQLEAWLRAQQKSCDQLELIWYYDDRRLASPQQSLTLQLAQAHWEFPAWQRVLAESLQRCELAAPVQRLVLQAGATVPWQEPAATLLPDPSAQTEALALLELLVARLGAHAVLQPHPVADHRPERANGWRSVIESPRHTPAAPAGSPPPGTRPFWLLATPEPLATVAGRPARQGVPLRLLAGPERIEAGWWEGEWCARDYFVAQDVQGGYCWVYCERGSPPGPWWLHGWFG